MKIITSPAKLMTLEHGPALMRSTKPVFIDDAQVLQEELKTKTPEFLAELMDISGNLARENWERNQYWTSNPTPKKSNQALYAFIGEVYRGLDAKTLDKDAVNYLKKNYRILSGLYGYLKPSDRIMLYRLEMGRKFQTKKARDLYSFWKDKVTDELNKELSSRDLLINLASNEYFKVLNRKEIKSKIIDFEFLELKDDKLKNITVYTKHARGLMVRYLAITKAKTLNEVKGFNLERYMLDENLSTDTKLVFTR